MITQFPTNDPRVLGFTLSGKLHDEDYKHFVPIVDEAIAHQGKVRMVIRFLDFHGWDTKAMWDDFAFATTHCTTIERLAMIGETSWERWMAVICKPFTMAKVKYFTHDQEADAMQWIVAD